MSSSLPAVADRSGAAPAAPASASAQKKRVLLSLDILTGKPWTARKIRNLNLRAHCRMMGRAFPARSPSARGWYFKYFALLCAVVESRSRIFTELHPSELPAVPALYRMAWRCYEFVRKAAAWKPDPLASPLAQWQSLVSHLFEKWPVAPAFSAVWFIAGTPWHIERDWYQHLATGGSMRSLPGMPPLRASAVSEVLLEPACRSAREAVRRAQLRALRCPAALTKAVFSSTMGMDFSNDSVWIPLLEKFIAGPPESVEDFGLVTDGFRFIILDGGSRRAVELLRYPLKELVCHWRKKWREYLGHAIPDHSDPAKADLRSPALRGKIARWLRAVWSPMADVAPFASRHGSSCRRLQHWTIAELCTQRDLVREGTRMRHCVAIYVSLCRSGRNAIFRMRMQRFVEEEPVASRCWTIRVRTATRCVVEVKGYRNRLPDAEVMEVVRIWAAENRLRLSPAL